MSGITGIRKDVTVFLRDIATIVLSYNRLLLYKSITGASGDYTAITDLAAAAAVLTGVRRELFSLNGKTLLFNSDGVVKTATFTTEITATDVAAKIQADTGIVTTNYSGYIRITSGTTGTASTLEIVDSSEGGVGIGLYEEDWATGKAAAPVLVAGTMLYVIPDYNGSSEFWYKYRYYSTVTGATSDISAPFQARAYEGISAANLIYGTAQFVNSEGLPIPNLLIKVRQKFLKSVESKIVCSPDENLYYSSSSGEVIIPFIKGSYVTVTVENTRLVRDFTVPSAGSSFDLLGASLGLYDELGISTYVINDMVRTAF